MLALDQLLANTEALTVLRGELIGEIEGVVDNGGKKGKVEPLRVRNVVDCDGHRLAGVEDTVR